LTTTRTISCYLLPALMKISRRRGFSTLCVVSLPCIIAHYESASEVARYALHCFLLWLVVTLTEWYPTKRPKHWPFLIWVLIRLINPSVLSGCIKDIYKWSRELARNVLEFCWHSISIIVRKVLQHAVQSYDVGLLALLTIRRKVCCGFLSPLKIHRIGQAWTYVLSVQWQAHWSHHQGGSYCSDLYHSMVDCGYSISLCILTFHHNALQDRLTAAAYLALCRDSSFKISIYATTFHMGRKKFCLMPWLKSYLFPEYIQFETCETEQIGIVLML
jgi:hypothetical protein